MWACSQHLSVMERASLRSWAKLGQHGHLSSSATLAKLHGFSESSFLTQKRGTNITCFRVAEIKWEHVVGVQERAHSILLPLVTRTPQATISQGLGPRCRTG